MKEHLMVKHCCYFWLIAFALAVHAGAGEVVFRVTARNPGETDAVVNVKSYLPPDIRPEHIRDLDGMELACDVRHNMYYVRATPELAPGVVNRFALRLDDIWMIPTQYIDRIEQHVESLRPRLRSGEQNAGRTGTLLARALDTIRRIRERQTGNVAGEVSLDDHMDAYNVNILALEEVVEAVREIENVLIGEGSDPGWLIPYFFRPKTDTGPAAVADRPVVTGISVTNSSPTGVRTFEVRRSLPFGVSEADVVSAGGLAVEMDEEKGLCYVVTNGLQLAAQESVTFSVVLRDRWNVNGDRMESLGIGLVSDLTDAGKLMRYISVEESLKQLISDLSDIREDLEPDEFGAEYIAFYGIQSKRLDAIEAMWKRIQSIEFPAVPIEAPPDRAQPRRTVRIAVSVIVLAAVLILVKSLRRGRRR